MTCEVALKQRVGGGSGGGSGTMSYSDHFAVHAELALPAPVASTPLMTAGPSPRNLLGGGELPAVVDGERGHRVVSQSLKVNKGPRL